MHPESDTITFEAAGYRFTWNPAQPDRLQSSADPADELHKVTRRMILDELQRETFTHRPSLEIVEAALSNLFTDYRILSTDPGDDEPLPPGATS